MTVESGGDRVSTHVKRTATIRLMLQAGALLVLCVPGSLAQHVGPHGMGMGGPMRPAEHGMTSGAGHGAAHASMAPTRPVVPQLGLPGRWWDERRNMKTLSLRPDQKQHMDEIFKASKATLAAALNTLQREESNLSTMSAKDRQDETKMFAAISRVEAARVDLAKQATHVQMQIRQQLDPEQLSRLDAAIASLR
jgi:Spy/CpxP family protein refolding chaperone